MNKRARLNYINALSQNVEHKKMYKAKKQWVVAGISFLVATGMGAIGSHLTTHAATSPQINTSIQKNDSVKNSSSNNKPSAAATDVGSQAKMMHQGLMLNAKSSNADVKNSSVATNSSSVESASSVDSVNSGSKQSVPKTAPIYQKAAPNSAYADYLKMMSKNKTTTTSATNEAPVNNKADNTKNNIGKASSSIKNGNFDGWNYKYDPSTQSLEVLNGTFHTSWYRVPVMQENSDFGNAKSIKFDNNISLGNLYDLENFFGDSKNLVSLDLGSDFDTSHINNMNHMFNSDTNLTYLNLGKKFNTSDVTNMNSMFRNTSLTSLDLSGFNTQKVTDFGYMLEDNHKLNNLNLGNNFTINNASDSSEMFANDSDLTNLTLPNGFYDAPAKPNTMNSMFGDMHKLQTLDLGQHFNTSKVTNMNTMFIGEYNLTNLNLGSDFNTQNVTSMDGMFSDEHALKSLVLPKVFNTSQVTNMAHMFDSDYSLQTLILPSDFTTKNVTDMYDMFINDGNGKNMSTGKYPGVNITLSKNFDTSKAITNNNAGDNGKHNGLSDMFQYDRIHSLTVPSGSNVKLDQEAQLPSMYTMKDSTYTNATPTNLTDSIPTGTYYGIKNVPDEIAPSNVPQVAYGSWGSADWNLYNNGQLDIHDGQITNDNTQALDSTGSHIDWSKVTSIDTYNDIAPTQTQNQFNYVGIFENLPNLRTADLSNMDFSNTSDMGNFFANDSKLTTINFGNKVDTHKLGNLNNTFWKDIRLQTINGISDFDVSNVYSCWGTFGTDTSLTHLDLSKWNINQMALTQEAGMFSDNSKLNNNLQTLELGNNTKFTKRAQLGGNWINIDANNPQSVPSNNLEDGNSHPGTWTHNAELIKYVDSKGNTIITKLYKQPMNSILNLNDKLMGNIHGKYYALANPSNNTITVNGSEAKITLTPKQDKDTVAFYTKYGKYDVLVTKANVTGSDGSKVSISKDIPSDYTLPNGASSDVTLTADTPTKDINLVLKNGHSINNSDIDEEVTPEPANADIQYQYNNQTVTSDSTDYHGNNYQASDAGNNSTTISDNNDKGLPSGWYLANKDTTVKYDNGKHPVDINPIHVSDNVIYQYKGSNENNGNQLGSHSYGGNDYQATQAKDNGIDITSNNVQGLRQGYHLVNKDNNIQFNGEKQYIPVEPNGVTSTATLHLRYIESNGHIDKSSDINIPINANVDDNLTLASPLDYAKDGYTVPNSDFTYTVSSQGKNSPSDTFTYEAPTAANVNIQYYDTVTGHHLTQYDKSLVASDMEKAPYNINWIVGKHIKLGEVGANDGAIDVLKAPAGYKFANNYPITTVILPESKVGVTLHVGLIKAVAPNSKSNSNSNSNSSKSASSSATNSAQSASTSMNSSELSSLAHEIGGDINVTVRPNVTNTTVDSTTLNSLASEVATNNQEISSLVNKPASTESINYDYFNNLVDNGVNKLTNAINKDLSTNIHNVHDVHAKPVTPKKTVGKRTYSYLKWLRVVKPLKLYNNNHEAVKVIRPRHRITLNVKAAYKVHNHIIFKVSYRSHNYFIKANNKAIKNAYLPASHKLAGRKVRVLYNVYANKHVVSGRVKTLHNGYSARIKNIIRIGSHNVTRIQLTNGLWISANLNYVKIL